MRRSAYGPEAEAAKAFAIPVEAPVAIETNGIAYAVMMATPVNLEDFVTGFLMAEGLADAGEVGEVALHTVENGEWGTGHVARVNLPPDRLGPIVERARRRVGDSSCGICGIEGVEAALRPLPALTRRSGATPEAIGRALGAFAERQPLGASTRASHAAAFCDESGAVLLVREDVGRHNALDKLIGALARRGTDPAAGFIIMTSRCSYELVEKTVRAGCPMLVTISAPTDLAVRRAKAAGLSLAVVARDDSMLLVC
ncbi:formate dehydrogenase accessory sulfurtransferase FdhD [Novosphingobium mangrovi (ex Huang et al. 2023)]|uniref:Sulfur carrier protein FdhD n=1 Tax=Novosphingobium mangrovi (ex Huang et al. 2023) TaxID=2976432 RepID=A0ABT2I2X1_9SPHN|nr:formate dehydrogenase accessory sulfurtransferase FdhD [Novosphingobium mangrovi (ex Huang et al. 2023)]MCT2398952.1 formate dehydrogenase accessory sulfurtransferase FdhD [Novosphingobium mangrovi (ex Huang et al. 2023)]